MAPHDHPTRPASDKIREPSITNQDSIGDTLQSPATQSKKKSELSNLEQVIRQIFNSKAMTKVAGTVTSVERSHYCVSGLQKLSRLGDIVHVDDGTRGNFGEVIRLSNNEVTIKPFETMARRGIGSMAWLSGELMVRPHTSWRGRSVNALAQPIDEEGELQQGVTDYPLNSPPPPPLSLSRISKPITTGVKVVDLFTPLCCGQRIGIFAGSGVGKSSLLGMLAKGQSVDTVVLAMIGERGREVREFLDEILAEHKTRTVCIVASGADSAMMRRIAPSTALCVAEFFRDQGDDVLLLVDSLTRFAHASREVALAAGEAPVARGFPPSVFSDLPSLLERAGPGLQSHGSITGIFSVLVDADDHNDPIADCVRGILDGHIILDRSIAEEGRYPAVNFQSSISRLAHVCWNEKQRTIASRLRALAARYEETRDLRSVGAYQLGSDPELDEAVTIVPKLYAALIQRPGEPLASDAFESIAHDMAQ